MQYEKGEGERMDSVSILNVCKKWFRAPLWFQIVVGLVLGSAVGLIFGNRVEPIEVVGQIFIHAIQMLVVPVVFTAIVYSITSLDNLNRMTAVALKAMVVYGLCMLVAASLGVIVANIIHPGSHIHLSVPHALSAKHQLPTLSSVLLSFVPSSPVAALAKNDVIQTLVFALLLGIAIKLTGEKGKPVADLFKSFSEVAFKFAEIIIRFSPYGVFALVACVFGKYGLVAVIPLLKFVGSVYLACILQCVLVYSLVLIANRINPWSFYKNIFSPLIVSFTTSSSAATLPITMKCAEEKLKISKNLSSFLLPFGTHFNLNGLSIYLGTATIFAANLYGIHLNMADYITMVVMITFTAMGAAAVPGSALVIMSAVMSSVGIPLGALALIAGVDRFNDMIQTMTNVAGDLFATRLVAKSEGELCDDESMQEVEIKKSAEQFKQKVDLC